VSAFGIERCAGTPAEIQKEVDVDERNLNKVAARVARGLARSAAQQQTRRDTAARQSERERATKDVVLCPRLDVLARNNP
jgi:hypothetical protein